ncbi:MAG: methyltransferase domain-containing protein [Proteobacteria bacterium]|nr:methyltransferase domain-containing protein [Pseudomonadota bacterium]
MVRQRSHGNAGTITITFQVLMPDASIQRTLPSACMLKSDLPVEFDARIYRQANPDLLQFDDTSLERHYREYGRREGRLCSFVGDRSAFFSLVGMQGAILEIGPLANPSVRGPNVKYFDVLGTQALRAKARANQLDPDGCPEIDYVSDTGDLGVIDARFDAVVSSHAIEHQPDLVRHLYSVARILGANGRYFLAVPDKRYCFDHFICETTIADVLGAYAREAKLHEATSIVRHFVATTHNDSHRHWRGDHGEPAWKTDSGIVTTALDHVAAMAGSYADAHAWQFSPDSFAELMSALHACSFSPFSLERVYSTLKGSLEFYAVLKKESDAPVPVHAAIPADFDERQYLLANPDVAAAGMDAREHYLRYGRREGRRLKI